MYSIKGHPNDDRYNVTIQNNEAKIFDAWGKKKLLFTFKNLKNVLVSDTNHQLVLHLKDLQYVFVGSFVCKFRAKSLITSLKCYIGEYKSENCYADDDAGRTYAFDENMIVDKIVPNPWDYFDQIKTINPPFKFYVNNKESKFYFFADPDRGYRCVTSAAVLEMNNWCPCCVNYDDPKLLRLMPMMQMKIICADNTEKILSRRDYCDLQKEYARQFEISMLRMRILHRTCKYSGYYTM